MTVSLHAFMNKNQQTVHHSETYIEIILSLNYLNICVG